MRSLSIFWATVAVASMPHGVRADTIRYDFDDGTLQGWTQVLTGGDVDRGDDPPNNQTQGTFRFEVIANSEPLTNLGIGGYLPLGQESSHSGDYRILPTPFYHRDDNTVTQLLRSPEFKLDGSGDLTAQVLGGDEDNPPPATSAELTPATAGGGGFQGVALRRVSDDAYILFGGKTSNGGTWQQVTFSQAALAAHVSATETYTLDFIDHASGGWGWVGLDTVEIPGTEVGDGEFQITEIAYAPGADMVTLTWSSTEGEFYAVRYSFDLRNWVGDLGDGIAADPGDSTTKEFDLSEAGIESEEDVFFRVEVEGE